MYRFVLNEMYIASPIKFRFLKHLNVKQSKTCSVLYVFAFGYLPKRYFWGSLTYFLPPRAHDRVILMQTPLQLKAIVTVCRSRNKTCCLILLKVIKINGKRKKHLDDLIVFSF